MAKGNNVFKRKEKKYLLSMSTYDQLRAALSPYMSEDDYGLHTILSLYYDTCDCELVRKSIEKPKYKEKFRIRSYGGPAEDSLVFLEIKKKIRGTVYKRRISLGYNLAKEYTKNPKKIQVPKDVNQQIKQEIDWLFQRKKLEPKVLIAYDRLALTTNAVDLADFRVTFDFNIRYRTTTLDLTQGDAGELVAPELVAPRQGVLMEVKALGAYPLWFSEILSNLTLYPASFSKYGETYRRHLAQEELQYVI